MRVEFHASNNMKNKQLNSLFAKYTIPALIAMLVSGTYQIVGGVFVGHYIGSDGLAAMSLVWPLLSIPLAFGVLIGVGAGSYISLSSGRGDGKLAAAYLGQVPLWIIVTGILVGGLLFSFGDRLLALEGAEGHVLALGESYTRIIALGAPLVIGSIAVPYLMRNLNAPRLATVFMVVGALINILLDYVFIVQLHLELVGVALATLIGETTAMVLALVYILSRRSPLRVRLIHCWPRLKLCWQIGLNGSSSLFMFAYLGAIVVLHNVVLLKYGSSVSVAAYSITGYLLTFYYLLAEGMAHGMQPLVSQFYAAGKVALMNRVLRMALWFGVGGGMVYTLLLLLFPHFFAMLFVSEQGILSSTIAHAIRMHLFALFLEGFFVTAAAFFQAIGEGHKALFITLGNMLINIPFLLFIPLWLGVDGAWLAMPVACIMLLLPVGYLLLAQLKQINSRLMRLQE